MPDSIFFWAMGAGVLSFASIAIGASLVYLKKTYSRKTLDVLFGMAGGMMLCAAFLGLLHPAYQMSEPLGRLAFVPVVAGLAVGVALLMLLDCVLPHFHAFQNEAEGISTQWKKSLMVVFAMALHHVPEGLAIGVSYAAAEAVSAVTETSAGGMSAALLLSASIMLQNLPEGLIVSTVLLAEGMSKARAALMGVLSGLTSPLGVLLGLLGAQAAHSILPYTLAFAAGAMVYIVVEEVIPEANASGNGNLASVACVAGIAFVIALSSLLGAEF